MSNPIFVALDTTDVGEAKRLTRLLRDHVGGIKLGLEFFAANGPAAVAEVAAVGLPLFLDLKFHDIPNTVAGAVRAAVALQPRLLTIHAAGGEAMMRAAVEAAQEEADRRGIIPPKIIAVTILTSLDQAAVSAIGYGDSLPDQVRRLAFLAQKAGIGGLVCSPHEVVRLRADLGRDLTLVVPGIRPQWSVTADDQKRIMTPRQAVDLGADVLVIGRPILSADDPVAAARAVADEVGA